LPEHDVNSNAMALGSLGAVLGIGAAVLTTGSDGRKVCQIGGLTLAGVGLGLMTDPDDDTLVGAAVGLLGVGTAVFGGQ
jgi:hypothetical protein